MGTMFTGSDKTGASLYYIDNDATRLRGRLFAVGSGGTFAYGVLDTNYRYDMSLDEAVALGIRAIASATANFCLQLSSLLKLIIILCICRSGKCVCCKHNRF